MIENSIIPNDKLLTEKQTAELLGFSVKTLQARRYMRQEPAFIRVSGKAVRYRYADLMAWLDRCRVEPRNSEGSHDDE